ncbi:MAG: DUF1653 domain-containing protein [Nitrospirales bacterium]|nr:DUF1653 domain-containing protein [Nitrospirales bacterium]
MIPAGRYRHYKGNYYQVIGVAKHSETDEELVVYRALYGTFELWVRPLTMFTEHVEGNGNLVSRFEFVEDRPIPNE